MTKNSLLGLTALLPLLAQATSSTTYTLQDSYTPANFLSSFNFFTSADPTHGFVSYVSKSAATSAGLATVDKAKKQVRLGVDTKSTIDKATVSSYNGGDYSVGGRKAIRLQSKKLYTTMLMVADIEHMPVGCGTWPALWSWGTASWPANGEIDVIEGANSQSTNAMTLHTSSGCIMTNTGQAPGTIWSDGTGDCNAGNGNTGCSQRGTSTSNFGKGFNNAQGGVYAMEWTDEAISIWFWPRSSIPSAIKRSSSSSSSSTINPRNFGTPLAKFTGGSGCDISKHFNGHAITINTALCGDWAGQNWESDSTCKKKARTCAEYVANNPEAFKDAYWLFNSIKVYTTGSSKSSKSGGEKRGISDMVHGAVYDVEGAWNDVKSAWDNAKDAVQEASPGSSSPQAPKGQPEEVAQDNNVTATSAGYSLFLNTTSPTQSNVARPMVRPYSNTTASAGVFYTPSSVSAAASSGSLAGTGSSDATDPTLASDDSTSSSASSTVPDYVPEDSSPESAVPVGSGTPTSCESSGADDAQTSGATTSNESSSAMSSFSSIADQSSTDNNNIKADASLSSSAPAAASLASVSVPSYQLNTTELADASNATVIARRQGKVSGGAGRRAKSKGATFPVLSLPQADPANILPHNEKWTGNGDTGCSASESSQGGVCELTQGADGRLPKMFVA